MVALTMTSTTFLCSMVTKLTKKKIGNFVNIKLLTGAALWLKQGLKTINSEIISFDQCHMLTSQ